MKLPIITALLGAAAMWVWISEVCPPHAVHKVTFSYHWDDASQSYRATSIRKIEDGHMRVRRGTTG